MSVIEIDSMDDFASTREDNPEAIICMRYDADCYDLFFPVGHPVGRYVVRC